MFGNFTVYAGHSYMSETAWARLRRIATVLFIGAIEACLLTYLLLLMIYSPLAAFQRSSNAWPWMNLNSYFSILLHCLSEIIQTCCLLNGVGVLFDRQFTAFCRQRPTKKPGCGRKTARCVHKFDTYRNLQRHRAIHPAIARLLYNKCARLRPLVWFRPLFTALCYAAMRQYVVCLSVRDVQVPWSHRLENFENNFTSD